MSAMAVAYSSESQATVAPGLGTELASRNETGVVGRRNGPRGEQEYRNRAESVKLTVNRTPTRSRVRS